MKLQNWRTKLAATITGLVNVLPIVLDGIQDGDLQQIGTILGAVATVWFLRDALPKKTDEPTKP